MAQSTPEPVHPDPARSTPSDATPGAPVWVAEKKISALECANVQEMAALAAAHSAHAPGHPPCVLLDPRADLPKAPPEDEAADPVGDGHSDADFAARIQPGTDPGR